MKLKFIYGLFFLFLSTSISAHTIDIRMCGEPERYKSGKIKRSTSLLNRFKEIYPCPSTGFSSGSCEGWSIDHVIPLACGGCDAIHNLQWLPYEIKSAAGDLPKDRWERKIYCKPMKVIKWTEQN